MRRLVVNLRDTRPIWSVTDRVIERIRKAADHFDVVVVDDIADGRGDGGKASPAAISAMRDAEVYFGFGFPEPLFSAATPGTLRWVHSATAGIGGSLYPSLVSSGLVLTNSAGIHAEPIADSVIAGIFHFARGLDFACASKANAEWNSASYSAVDSPVHEIAGTNLGIIGYGGIGRAAAERALALGMKVKAMRRSPASDEGSVIMLAGEEGLEEIIAGSQYLLLAAPLTEETREILDADRISRLRRDAVVINIGRGELVDEEALTDALAQSAIRGAALDVFRKEPLSSESRLWDLPNVLITPHVSATTHQFWDREVELMLDNLGRYSRGEPLLNVVNKKAGY